MLPDSFILVDDFQVIECCIITCMLSSNYCYGFVEAEVNY